MGIFGWFKTEFGSGEGCDRVVQRDDEGKRREQERSYYWKAKSWTSWKFGSSWFQALSLLTPQFSPEVKNTRCSCCWCHISHLLLNKRLTNANNNAHTLCRRVRPHRGNVTNKLS